MRKAKTNFIYITALLFFCIIYVWTFNDVLPDYYYVYTTPIVSYGKNFSLVNMMLCLIVIVWLFLLTFRICTQKNMISYVLKILFFLYCIPMTMSFCLFQHDNSLSFWLLGICYWVILCLFCKYVKFNFKKKTIRSLSKRMEKILLTLSVIIVIAFIASQLNGFHFSLTLKDVYKVRLNFKTNTNAWMVFIKSAFGFYICPCILAFSIKKKNKVNIIVFTLLQLVLFSFAKDKMFLINLFVAIVFGLLSGRIAKAFDSWMLGGITALGVLNLIPLFGYFQNFIYMIFTRRLFVIPAWLNYLYYDYFSSSQKLLWRQDVFLIDKLFDSVYDASASLLISDRYFGGKVSNPNAGMLAEAYSQFGIPGIIIYPFLFAVLLNILNYFFKETAEEVKLMTAFSLAVSFTNDTISSTTFVVVMVIIILYSYLFRVKGGVEIGP